MALFGGLEFSKNLPILRYASELQKINPKLNIIIQGSLFKTKEYHCVDIINTTKDTGSCSKSHFVDTYNTQEEKEIRQKYPSLQFTFFDPKPLFCSSSKVESCSIYIQNQPIFFDSNHLNYHGIMEQVKRIRERPELMSELEQALTR